jgi:hypothetical protein
VASELEISRDLVERAWHAASNVIGIDVKKYGVFAYLAEIVKAAAPEIDRDARIGELERMAERIRVEAADPLNQWRPNETYRAQKIFALLRDRAAELRGGEQRG